MAALDDAANIAGESKGVIAGTVALLALWFLRKPILSAISTMLGADTDERGQDDNDY